MNNKELAEIINTTLNSNNEFISKKDLIKTITDIYDTYTKTEKKTREPTAYNIFMKEQMAILKETEEGKILNTKEKMQKIAKMWSGKQEEEIKEKGGGNAPRKALGFKKK